MGAGFLAPVREGYGTGRKEARRSPAVLDWREGNSRTCVSVCVHTLVSPNTPQFCLPRGPRSNSTPGAMCTPSVQILDSKYHYLVKGIRAPWRNGWFLSWGRKGSRWVQSILLPKSKDMFKGWWKHVNRTLEPAWRAPHWPRPRPAWESNEWRQR